MFYVLPAIMLILHIRDKNRILFFKSLKIHIINLMIRIPN